jgi:hypothetical protein
MTSHEIRESVIGALSAEARVREYFKQREELALKYEIAGPAIFMQAMPLIALEQPWPVLDEPIKNIIRGHGRRGRYGGFVDLVSDIRPTPIIEGVMGRESRTNTAWFTEVHRNGYVSVLFRWTQTTADLNVAQFRRPHGTTIPDNGPMLHSGACQLFRAYCDLLAELWATTGNDLPYVLTCTFYKAANTLLWFKTDVIPEVSEVYTKEELRFPMHYRQIGQNPTEIADLLCGELFNAFGIENVAE